MQAGLLRELQRETLKPQLGQEEHSSGNRMTLQG